MIKTQTTSSREHYRFGVSLRQHSTILAYEVDEVDEVSCQRFVF